MPKKRYTSNPPIFRALYRAALEVDRDFVIWTDDPVTPAFADKLIAQHYPARHGLTSH